MILMIREKPVHKRDGPLYQDRIAPVERAWSWCSVAIPKDRSSRTWDKVTCKNCLRSRPKRSQR